ncbi:MAG: hypothetical protein KAT58_02545, partial [candidate division Zixibacteria bacterium]|nr:hypothetical protein [candidate division Zixibacteria bacterium]
GQAAHKWVLLRFARRLSDSSFLRKQESSNLLPNMDSRLRGNDKEEAGMTRRLMEIAVSSIVRGFSTSCRRQV